MAGGIGAIVAGLLIGTINTLTTTIYENTSGRAMKDRVEMLRKQINEDSDLKMRLMDAYNSKNINLFNNIISTVPGGFANEVAKLEKQVKEAIHKQKMSDIDKNISDNTSKASEIETHQITNDNISNAINTDWWNKYNGNYEVGKVSTDPSKYNIKDQYGNNHIVSHKQLESWTYGHDKAQGLETVKKNNNSLIQIEKRK